VAKCPSVFIEAFLRLKFATDKILLRELSAKRISREIANRSKMGFGIPRDYWIKNDLKKITDDFFLSDDSFITKWLDKNQFRLLYKRYLSGENQVDHGVIWSIFSLELWARRWLK
jgi:asparagine synthase (glutamine-hydrolysing)